jgi:isocitrate dehydrogenase
MALRLVASRLASRSAPKRVWSIQSLAVNQTPIQCYMSTDASEPSMDSVSLGENIPAPPMVYISGEEMTHYASNLIVDQWIKPYFDISAWETFDLSCKSRDETDDKVLHDAVAAGKRIGAIFKEPTITPSAVQVEEMGLSKAFGSPNGAMRKGWNGITISRDTIHIKGIELGYKNQVLFERHAVGGEYGAGWNQVGEGTLLTTYLPSDGAPPFVVDKRDLSDENNVVVVYHNPYDNVKELAHLFFKRCLEHKVTPYVVTKKTVFKWQEGFWATMKEIFDKDYKDDFLKEGLLERSGDELVHLISDAATMQLIRWTDGGFGMAAHNYDGDMLTDQIAQVHRSPGFITSNLVGVNDDGSLIKEFEASHGTVSDLWHDHLAGKETSLNPLGLVEAMIGAMQHAAMLDTENNPDDESKLVTKMKIMNFTETLREAMHNTFRYGQGTRDMSGPSGFTTEDFVAKVAWRLQRYLAMQDEEAPPPQLVEPTRKFQRNLNVDTEAVNKMFQKFDKDGDGMIDYTEFEAMMIKLNLAPKKKSEDDEKEPWGK